MPDSSVSSLVYVCRVSGARLRDLGRQLESAEPRRVEPILRAIQAEGDGLSAALTRLAQYADALPDEETARSDDEPVDDPRPLMLARQLRAIISGAMTECPECGGYVDSGGDHGRIEFDTNGIAERLDQVAKARARRAQEAQA